MPGTQLVICGCTDNCKKLVSIKTRRRHWKRLQEEQAEELAVVAGTAAPEQDNNSVDSQSNTSRSEHLDDIVEEEDAETVHTRQEDAEMEDDPWPNDDWSGMHRHDEDMVPIEEAGEEAGDGYGGADVETGRIDADMNEPSIDGESDAEEEFEDAQGEILVPVVRDFGWDDYYYSGPITYDEDDGGNLEPDETNPIPTPEARQTEPVENPHQALLDVSERLKSVYYHEKTEENVRRMGLLQTYQDSVREELSSDELDNLIAFSLRSMPGINSTHLEYIRAAFSHRMNLDSEYKNKALVAEHSGLFAREVHCCAKSCMAFTGDDAELETCRYCNEPRYDSRQRPRNISYHFSLIDRLQGMFMDPEQSRKLNRDNREPNRDPDILADKFDGDYFKELSQKMVEVEGVSPGHRYFQDGRDIGLTISLDGFTFFQTLGKHTSSTKYSTWLVIAMIDNIDPITRTQRKNILILAVIPGPGSPKDFNSYLHWLREDLHLLSIGVLSWDAAKREFFLLRAYLLWILGDMPAIADIMNMKGHNGKCPCRACYIIGIRDTSKPRGHYYPVLCQLNGTSIDAPQLLEQSTRTHQSFREDLDAIDQKKAEGCSKAEYKNFIRDLGINGRSILWGVDSVDFPRSFIHDLMHLGALNTIPNLVKIWTGEFPGLRGVEDGCDYLISKEDWEIVGKRTEDANKFIPYAFSRAIPNLAEKPSMTADAWFFWFLFIAPYALDKILKDPYYKHAMELVDIIHSCMKFEITRTEVKGPLTAKCRKWVTDYENLYYRGQADRLAACPSTLHAWLHVPQDILNAGPSWQSWAFPMEREVQWAKAGVKDARHHPFVHMANRALRREQLKQLGHRLHLSKLLDIKQRVLDLKIKNRGPKHKEFELCSPREPTALIEPVIRRMMAAHFAALYGATPLGTEEPQDHRFDDEFFTRLIPKRGEKWYKVQIIGGEMAHGSDRPVPFGGHRDASFVRYHMFVGEENRVHYFYGQLQYIYKVTLPSFGDQPETIHLLAFIKPCDTGGMDATKSRVYYTEMGALGVADLTCLVATVGRVPMGNGRYGIVDRSIEEAWPTVFEEFPSQLAENDPDEDS